MNLLTITGDEFTPNKPPRDYRGVVYTPGGREKPFSAWIHGLLWEYTATQGEAEHTLASLATGRTRQLTADAVARIPLP